MIKEIEGQTIAISLYGYEIRCNTLIRSAVTPIAVTSPPALNLLVPLL